MSPARTHEGVFRGVLDEWQPFAQWHVGLGLRIPFYQRMDAASIILPDPLSKGIERACFERWVHVVAPGRRA